MSQNLKDFIRNWFDEVWNKGNEKAIDAMFHPVGKAHGLGAEAVIGPENFKGFYLGFMDTYADIKVTIDKILVDGIFATAICSVSAVYKKTGKPVHFTGTSTALVENNMIIEGWNHFDFLSLYMQIGKIKPGQLSEDLIAGV